MKRVVILALLVALLGAHSLLYPPGRDQGIYSYIGWQMTEGKLPYRDLWDFKPPAIYPAYALCELVFGHNTWGIRVFELVWQMLAALAIFAFASGYYKSPPAGAAATLLYIFALFQHDFWHTAQPDGLLNLFVVSSFILAVRERAIWWILGGVSLGLAFWFKYPAGVFVLPFAVLLLQKNKRTKPAILSGLGFTATILTGTLILAASGMLDPLLDIQSRTVAGYTAGGLTSIGFVKTLLKIFGILNYPYCWGPILWVPALIGLAASKRRIAFESALILSGIVCFTIQGKLFPYHDLPLVLALAIPAGYGFSAAWDLVKASQLRRIALCVIVFTLALPGLSYRIDCLSQGIKSISRDGSLRHAHFALGRKGDYFYKASFTAAQYIKSHTSPGDTVFIWGFEPIVYYLSERRCPSRFIYNVPFFGTFDSSKNRKELMDTLEATPPKYFVILRNDFLEHVTGTDIDSLGALKQFPELTHFLKNRYALEKVIEDFIILSTNSPETPLDRS